MYRYRTHLKLITLVSCITTVIATGQAQTIPADPDEQAFLQARAEKTLMNPKKENDYQTPMFQALSALEKLPKGNTSLVKLADYYKKQVEKTPTEQIAGDTWTQWHLRLVLSLSRHPAVKKDLTLFPDQMISDYVRYFLAKDAVVPASSSGEYFLFVGSLGPRAKGALPRLQELENHDDAQIALRAHQAIKKIKGQK
jgi:hypothetical protein